MAPTNRPRNREKTASGLAPFELDQDVARERYLRVTGEVVWGWNALHRTLGYVFMALLGDHQRHVSNALWLTPGSEKAQRDLLRTAVEWADSVRPPHRERLLWALDQTDRLATYRNDIVHGHPGTLISDEGLTFHLSSGQNAFRRVLKHQKIDTPFHLLMGALCDDLRRLEHFVAEILRRMHPVDSMARPSPRRPVLRALALVEAGQKRTHVAQSRKGRKGRGGRRQRKPASG